jgi:hypothetical protein
MRNDSDKNCRENPNINFSSITLFFFENCVVNEMMWKNILAWGRPWMTIWQQQIGKGASTLRLTYIACFDLYDVVLTDKFDLESKSLHGWNISF